ncbi:MAG TPA: tripartite tricarboxylate transporter substrate binding protein [Burkholderiaceae bacterium]|nr:tripartite tricarboxylate transporter substrate binding protein [Burkholderiaceae bacterium]
MKSFRRLLGGCLAALLVSPWPLAPAEVQAQTQAQAWPSKPVRIVVPAAAGGGLDLLVRALGRELTTRWGQPVTIDNRGGASGVVGTLEVVSRGGKDGHTLLAVTDNLLIHNRFVFRNLAYDPDRDLTAVAIMAKADQLLIATHSLPANDMRELVALAKREGSRITYGAWGDASQPQLVYSALNSLAGTEITQVNYKGVAPVMVALAGNEVQLSVISGGTAGPLLKQGKIKVLAAASRERLPEFPDVATTAEQGFPSLQSIIWFGLMAPAGTPSPIIERIADDTRAVLADPAFAEANVTSKGWRVLGGGPKEFADTVRQQTPVIADMIKAAGIQPQ